MQEKTGREFSDIVKQRQAGEISNEQFMAQVVEERKRVEEMARVNAEIKQEKQREAERVEQIQNQIDKQPRHERERDLER